MPEEKEEDEEDLLKLTQMKMIQREYWIKTMFQGLPWQSSGEDSALPTQGKTIFLCFFS